MATSPQCLRWLEQLLAAGEATNSSIPKSIRQEVTRLEQMGWLVCQARGRGLYYTVRDVVSVRALLEHRQYHGKVDDLTPKGRAVALSGDAHRGRLNRMMLLLASSTGAIWNNPTIDEKLLVGDLTKRFGVSALAVEPGDDWRTDQTIVLVENREVLLYSEKFTFEGTLLYYAGKISGRLADWLAEKERTPQIVVFPDYDPVGLLSYLRLKDLIPSVTLHIPPNLEALLTKHHNPSRLIEQQQYLPALEESHDQTVRRIMELIMLAGGGLDQEIAVYSPAAMDD